MDLKGRGSNREKLIPASEMKEVPQPPYQESCPVQLPDGDWLDLPLLPLPPDFDTAIAFLCSNQTTFEVEDRLTTEMAKLARQWDPGSGYRDADPGNGLCPHCGQEVGT